MEQDKMIVVHCECQCGGSFESKSFQTRYLPGHSPSARNNRRRRGAVRKGKTHGEDYIPPARKVPTVAEALAAKPDQCDKCGNTFLVQDDILDTMDSGLMPYVDLIEWYCPMCSKRFMATNLMERHSREQTVDNVR